jgi:hypothetical protein
LKPRSHTTFDIVSSKSVFFLFRFCGEAAAWQPLHPTAGYVSDLGEMRYKRRAHNAIEYGAFHADLRREGLQLHLGMHRKERPVEACLNTMCRTSTSLHSLTLHVIFLPTSTLIHGHYSVLNEYRVTSLPNHLNFLPSRCSPPVDAVDLLLLRDTSLATLCDCLQLLAACWLGLHQLITCKLSEYNLQKYLFNSALRRVSTSKTSRSVGLSPPKGQYMTIEVFSVV